MVAADSEEEVLAVDRVLNKFFILQNDGRQFRIISAIGG